MIRAIKESWLSVIRHAIAMGDADAVYRLTVAYVRRLREVGLAV